MTDDKFLGQSEALEICFKLVKPSLIGMDNYNKLRSYKNRYDKGKLGQSGIETVLRFFGYEKAELWYIKEKPQLDEPLEP